MRKEGEEERQKNGIKGGKGKRKREKEGEADERRKRRRRGGERRVREE